MHYVLQLCTVCVDCISFITPSITCMVDEGHSMLLHNAEVCSESSALFTHCFVVI